MTDNGKESGLAAAVEIRELVKRYKQTTVVHGISIDIQPGEFIVLIGPSGCGKSSTLRMIAGLEEVSGGEILIDGHIVNDVPPKDRHIAMVFQNYALYPHMTVRDNISFGLRLHGAKKDEIATAVTAAAEILGLEALLDRKPAELSGGQRQRVAMGRAIVRKPQVFLFDEPLSNLDAGMRAQMRAEIKRLHARLGTTVIYVTHDQVEAMTLADRIVVMRDGRVEQIGSPMDLFHRPENTFVASFIGSPAMNLLPALLEESEGHVRARIDAENIVRVPGHTATAGRSVIIGIRPENVRLAQSGDSPEISAIVDLVEPLGAETFIHVRVGRHKLAVRVEGHASADIGARISLFIYPAYIHLFDATTGVAIYRD